MNYANDIKTLLYNMVHRSKKSVAQLADETGISTNYLYRACNPIDESGVKFPVEYLIPLMKATNDYAILANMARICDRIVIKSPHWKNIKGEEVEFISAYQGSTIKALKCLKDFFNEPNKTNLFLVETALQEVMEKSASAQKYCKKKHDGQFELGL